MKIFVSGATGAQGSHIAKALVNKGYEVTSLSRSENKVTEGVDLVPGDLEDQSTIEKAMHGAGRAVFTLPLVFDTDQAKKYVANFITSAKNQGISLVIYNTNFDLPQEKNGFSTLDLKLELKKMFDESGLKVITLMPDIYLDNLAAPWSIPVILNQGILPYPVTSGVKTPWISHFDLGQYVAAAIEKPDLAGKTLPIGGNIVTGEELAEAISNQIGKSISFVGVKPGDFEEQLKPAFGEVPAREISNLYRYVEQHQEQLVSKDFEQTNAVLGIKPQPLNEWAASVKWEL